MQLDFNESLFHSNQSTIKIYQLTVVYAGFAFIISLVREIVKDIEDIEGDRKYSCLTMPIFLGIPITKFFISVCLIVLGCTLFFMMFYALLKGLFLLSGYVLFILIFPLVHILFLLFRSIQPNDFSILSNKIKIYMLLGILSMIIYYYHI